MSSEQRHEKARRHFQRKQEAEGTETVEEGGYVFERKKPHFRVDPAMKTFRDIENPWRHLSHEERTGQVPSGIIDTVTQDVGGGYAETLPYREHCQNLRFYGQVRYVMGERESALAGNEILEVCGPPRFRRLRLQRERIEKAQEQMHSLWKTLNLQGHYVAEDKLIEAHQALADVDQDLREQQREISPKRTDADQ